MKSDVRCIVFKRKKILLVKREDNGLWELPGGGIEENESYLKAAKRELKEETGLESRNQRVIGFWVNRLLFINKQSTLIRIAGIGSLVPSFESPEVKYWAIKDFIKLPKHIRKLIKHIESGSRKTCYMSLRDYEIIVIIKYIYGKIKRYLRKFKT